MPEEEMGGRGAVFYAPRALGRLGKVYVGKSQD